MNIKEQAIFKQVTDIVSQIAGEIRHPASNIKPSDSIVEVLDYDDISLAELILEVETKFGISIEYFMGNIKTIDDLCITITSLLSEKQPKQKVASNPTNFGKQQILQEISKMIVDADLSTEENPTFDTPLEQDFQFIDFAVYDAIEQKYNITLENMDHVKTVGDLCDYIMKKRIAKFQQDKKVHNKPVNFKASDKMISFLPRGGQSWQKEKSLLQRVKQRFMQLVK